MPPKRQLRTPARFEPYALIRPIHRNVLSLNDESFLKAVDISEIEEIMEQTSFNELISELPYTLETFREVIESQLGEGFQSLSKIFELPESFFEEISKLPESSFEEFCAEKEAEELRAKKDAEDLQLMMQQLADQGVVLPEVSEEEWLLLNFPNTA